MHLWLIKSIYSSEIILKIWQIIIYYFPLVFLYGYASEQEYRKTVPQIRAGEYEGLIDKVLQWVFWLNQMIKLH